MPELKPCPFCGSTTAPTVMNQNEAQWLDNDAENLSMVVCCAAKKFGCGASTGFCDTAEQAVEAWNTRTEEGMIEQEKAIAAAFGIVSGALNSKEFQNIALEALRQGLGIASNIKLEGTKNEAD